MIHNTFQVDTSGGFSSSVAIAKSPPRNLFAALGLSAALPRHIQSFTHIRNFFCHQVPPKGERGALEKGAARGSRG